MKNLNDYMLLFRMKINPAARPNQEQLAQIKAAWQSWIMGIAEQARLVSSYQLGFEGVVLNPEKNQSPGFHETNSESVTGNLTLKAESLEEAERIVKGCPVFHAGGSVEIRNVLTVY